MIPSGVNATARIKFVGNTISPPSSVCLDTALPSVPLLTVSERKKSGLILCRNYYAEFVGPGAVIWSPGQPDYQTALAIGSPDLVTVNTPEERQQAYGRRIQWLRWIQKIAGQPEPTVRAEKLLSGFEAFFGYSTVLQLPSEVLALLIGVFPATIDQVRGQTHGLGQTVSPFRCSGDYLKVAEIEINQLKARSESPIIEVLVNSGHERTVSSLRRSA